MPRRGSDLSLRLRRNNHQILCHNTIYPSLRQYMIDEAMYVKLLLDEIKRDSARCRRSLLRSKSYGVFIWKVRASSGQSRSSS